MAIKISKTSSFNAETHEDSAGALFGRPETWAQRSENRHSLVGRKSQVEAARTTDTTTVSLCEIVSSKSRVQSWCSLTVMFRGLQRQINIEKNAHCITRIRPLCLFCSVRGIHYLSCSILVNPEWKGSQRRGFSFDGTQMLAYYILNTTPVYYRI